MKNIHVLPTSQPSRLLYLGTSEKLTLQVNPATFRVFERSTQNIYITSDEEINQQTNPCWCINTIKNSWKNDLIYYQGSMPQYHFIGFKKIILTTDQDLIKDGVQAIDDEFLEWFVKNPSCEEVEIDSTLLQPSYKYFRENILKNKNLYKIIIPNEEPKQLNPEDFGLPQFGTKEFNDLASQFFGGKPKQKTLEEASKNHINYTKETNGYPKIQAFKDGAKWQKQNSYSEEEVKRLAFDFYYDMSHKMGVATNLISENATNVDVWFEQFKKK